MKFINKAVADDGTQLTKLYACECNETVKQVLEQELKKEMDKYEYVFMVMDWRQTESHAWKILFYAGGKK